MIDDWRPMLRLLPFYFLLLLASLACTIGAGGGPTPTATANVPMDQVVAYKIPVYSATLNPGETVKGSKLTYVGREGDIFNVTIANLPAAKRIGDSFAWRGVMAPGVVGNYNLRLSPTILSDDLLAAGSLEISILNPIPVELGNDFVVADSLLHFNNIAIDYRVPVGEQVPGTTLIFEGATDQGANLGGTSGFPIRALGDSLIWTGRLRGNAIVRYNLRVGSLNADELRLVGTAEMWITPSP
jgi:hypothetical protein